VWYRAALIRRCDLQVEICTFGQYLRPSRKHMRVYDYVALEKYEFWKKEGEALVSPPPTHHHFRMPLTPSASPLTRLLSLTLPCFRSEPRGNTPKMFKDF